MIKADDYRLKIKELKESLSEAGNALDILALKASLEEKQALSEQPEVFLDLKKSQEISKEIAYLSNRVNAFDKASKTVCDAVDLIDLAEEANDEDVFIELDKELIEVEKAIEEMRLTALLKGKYDKLNAILNDLEGQLYCNGEKVIIRSMRNDLIFETTPNVKISAPELIKNENGGFSHYEYSFKMPSDDLTINVDLSPNEPTLWDFSFNNHTGIENLFITDFMEEYAEGDVIEIDVNPDALIEDRGIILKANGVLVEGKNEWCVSMPGKPLKIDAYLINSSFGENWKYLNIIDKDDLLANFADGYYQVGKRVVIYTDYLIDIISEDGIQIDGLCVDDGEGMVEYIYSFEMPNSDLTVEITRQYDDNNGNE